MLALKVGKRVKGLSWKWATFCGVVLAILLVPPLRGGASAAEEILAVSPPGAPPAAGAQEASAGKHDWATLSDQELFERIKIRNPVRFSLETLGLGTSVLLAEVAVRFERYSGEQRGAMRRRFQDTAMAMPDGAPKTIFMSDVCRYLPSAGALAFLSPLLLEGDSWDDKATFVCLVNTFQLKNPGEEIAEALFQLYGEAVQARLDDTIPYHQRWLAGDIIGALGQCGEAGFERLQRLRRDDPGVGLVGVSLTEEADVLLQRYAQAENDSGRLSVLQGLCARPVRDYPADIQKFLHAEITRFLGSSDYGERQSTVVLIIMNEDEAYLPLLEALARNDPYSEEMDTFDDSANPVKVTRYPMREKALYAIEEIRKRCDRGQFSSYLKNQIPMLEQRLATREESATIYHFIPDSPLPVSREECENQLVTLRKELETLPSMDGALVSRRLCEENVKDSEIRLAAARARREKITDPALALLAEHEIKRIENSLQYYQKRLDKLLAQPAGK